MEEKFRQYTLDGKFEGNILIAGRTGSGKTAFLQNLGQNKMFGSDIIEVFSVSKILLSEERERTIRECFEDQNIQFAYPNNTDDFNYLIDSFMLNKSQSFVENKLGELPHINKLIIMDDVSGLADKSEEFSNFLIISRKYGFSCVYVFHTIYPGRQSWEIIMGQTHIFNFFPGSIHSGKILKTLSLFASRQKNTYLPNQQVWFNKLYFQISNSKEKMCLPVDTRDVNDLGPGKFRTLAENNSEQVCYFNRNNSDSHYISYQAKRVSQENIVFSIFKINYDLNPRYKNLDINSQKLLFYGDAREKHQSTDRGNFRDGKSSGSQTSKNDRGSSRSLQSEPTSARGGNTIHLDRISERGKYSKKGNRSNFGRSVRKKPRFLSN